MELRLAQIDAFADRPFAGNPAAVVPLEGWLPAGLMQAIAAENNLSETVFFVREGEGYRLRWFTPMTEVDLCGHATLAAAFLILTDLEPGATRVLFQSVSGPLGVARRGDLLELDFPSRPPRPIPPVPGLAEALGTEILETHLSRDVVAVLPSEAAVRALEPDFSALARIDHFGFIATARGDTCDVVSRFFVPREGIPEDPVTGSAHSTLVPFWAGRLGKTVLHARQLSTRGGELFCELKGDRVAIAGRAVKVLEGRFFIPDGFAVPEPPARS